MKSRRLRALLTLVGTLCLFLGLCGMASPSVEDLPSHLEQLHWRSEESEVDLKNFPCVPISFAVTANGYWAVAYQENIHCRLLLVAPDRTAKQYAFEADGSWAVDIIGRELFLYLARANTYFAADLFTGDWRECSRNDAFSLWELQQRRTVQQGSYTMTAVTGWNHYRLELNGETVLQANPSAIFLARLPYAVPVLIPWLVLYVLHKNLKRKKL